MSRRSYSIRVPLRGHTASTAKAALRRVNLQPGVDYRLRPEMGAVFFKSQEKAFRAALVL